MREIKFRVYDIKNNKMLNIDSLFLNEQMFRAENKSEYDVFNFNSDYYSDIMQYTGLKDKNREEIYEGDIVKDTAREMYKIKYQTKKARFIYIHIKSKDKIKMNQKADIEDGIEVIGNIYENPELLENQK